MVSHKRLTDAQKAQIEENNKAVVIEQELALHRPQVQQLSNVIRQQQLNVRFSKEELVIVNESTDAEFIPNVPNHPYEGKVEYGAFNRRMKKHGLELGLEMAEEKLALDLLAYEREKAKVDKLEKGELLSEL